jgi:Zn-dependent alcohol dehydrogenase
MKIRAAVLERFGEPLVVQELDLAEPGPGEVLVRPPKRGVPSCRWLCAFERKVRARAA